MNVNIAFLRHGFGCHNAMRPLINNNFLIPEIDMKVLNILSDPELTPLGVDTSIHNGCVISKLIKNEWKAIGDSRMKVDQIHLVGCSPLIRSMETAYYMTRKWNNPPSKIYVLPYLREVNESSEDIYSPKSRKIIDTIPSYKMKTIEEQKNYLRTQGILEYFDFHFVESDIKARNEPGDIRVFNKWLFKTILPNFNLDTMNLLVVTHAGVLRNFSQHSHYNNSGFLLNVTAQEPEKIKVFNLFDKIEYKEPKYNAISILDKVLPKEFFTDCSNSKYNMSYYCPSRRCGKLCNYGLLTSIYKNPTLKQITPQCDLLPQDNL